MHIQVENYFKDDGIVSIQISPAQTKVDMQYFIKEEVKKQQVDPRSGILKSNQKLRERVEAALSARASGMFQWVKLRIAVFFPMAPLESPERVETELRLLEEANPKDLNETYKRLYMENKNERPNTAKTYRIILSAYQPLTITEVVEAVSARADGKTNPHVNIEYIRKRCHNFIVENDNGFLEFSHESARLFLERAENHGDKNFVDVDDFSDTANHREMAKICLQVMAKCDHKSWANNRLYPTQCKRQFETTHTEEEGWKIFTQRGFARYVFLYWIRHCRRLSSNLSLGQELSTELTKILSEPDAAFSWWLSLILTPEPFRRLDKRFWQVPILPMNGLSGRPMELADGITEVWTLHLLARYVFGMTNSEAGSFPPHKFLAICVWDFIECLDAPRFAHILRDEKWPSTPFSPLHLCCILGSNRVLYKLIKDYPEEVSKLISFEKWVTPLDFAISDRNEGAARALLKFERDHARDHDRWSSKQLSHLRFSSHIYNSSMLMLLLEFEASQTGAHFPPRRGERWTSNLAQQPPANDKAYPLQIAARACNADVVSVLLKAGARSSIPSVGLSPFAEALREDGKRWSGTGSEIVDILMHNDPAFRDKVMDEHYILELGSKLSTEEAARMLKVRPELAWMRRQDGNTALSIALATPSSLDFRGRQLRQPAFFRLIEEYRDRQGYKLNHEEAQAIRQQMHMLHLQHQRQRRIIEQDRKERLPDSRLKQDLHRWKGGIEESSTYFCQDTMHLEAWRKTAAGISIFQTL